MDVRDHTTASDGSLDQSVKLFVAADSELQVTRSYSLHLKVLAGVTGELQDLSGQVLEDSSSVDGGRGADAAVRANSALQKSVDSSDRELKTKKLQLGFYLTFNTCNKGTVAPPMLILNLPGVQHERISTEGSSWTCPFRTFLPFLLCHLYLRPKKVEQIR